jgi:hypothetical protein
MGWCYFVQTIAMSLRWWLLFLSACFHCQLLFAQLPLPVDQEHHHRVLLKNDYIRVLEGLVRVRDTTPMHVHAANSVVVFLSHSSFGIQVAGEAPVVREVRPGDLRYADYGDKPVTHIVWDEGPEDFHFYVVELAARASAGSSASIDSGGSGEDTCSMLSQPGLNRQWRRGKVTAYYWDIPPGWHCALPAGDCAFFLIDLSAVKSSGGSAFHFYPPRHALSIQGHRREDAQYILLQLQVR